MKILNNTHYFNELSKVYNTFPEYNSFESESSRRMGYFQRLYFEYLYTLSVKGVAFFYTLTYNDKSIPNFLGRPSFNYEHIRYVTNGSLSKILKRHYGARLRYFCACEHGDGKGKRGIGNNPHYHFIFFVQPIHTPDDKPIYDGYKVISPSEFKKLILELWQGSSKWQPFQLCKFGIAKEGLNEGLVMSPDAFSYVGKYVIKDSVEFQNEEHVRQYYVRQMSELCNNSFYYIKKFYYHLKSKYSNYSRSQFVGQLGLLHYQFLRKLNKNITFSDFLSQYSDYYGISHTLISQMKRFFHETFIADFADQKVSEYRTMYGSKPRLSKSLGIYGLNFVKDIETNPRISIPTSTGFKVQYPCLYYIRKLYYDTVICPVTGNVLYVLSPLGRTFKCNQLRSRIDSLVRSTKENISYVYFNKLLLSHPSKDVTLEHAFVLDRVVEHKSYPIDLIPAFSTQPMTKDLNVLTNLPDYNHILWCYSVFKHVYEFRSFVSFDTQLNDLCLFSHVLDDYKLFLKHDFYCFDYDSGSVMTLLEILHYTGKLKSFSALPPFARYLKWFAILDSVNEQVRSILSENKRSLWLERSEHQKKLNQYRYNCSI